ncbi:MAG: hypothetical protein NT126_03520 [Bacteroidetes bacterium]|nr:hypothetical protein [Bacteroidota bacterium]
MDHDYLVLPGTSCMRNTTKLKTLLIKYTVSFDMGDDELFKLMLTDKQTNDGQLFEGKSYSIVLSKAYSYLLQQLKKTDSKNME